MPYRFGATTATNLKKFRFRMKLGREPTLEETARAQKRLSKKLDACWPLAAIQPVWIGSVRQQVTELAALAVDQVNLKLEPQKAQN